MKRFVTLLSAILMLSVATFAQEQHAHWKTRVTDLGEGLYSVSAIAKIDSSWHIYDTLRTDFGPNATIVNFDVLTEGKAEKVGVMTIDAPAFHKYYDDIFMMEIGVYDDSVVFSQQFRLLGESAKIHVFAEWMACDDNNCLPLADIEFAVNIPELDEAEEVGAFTANSGGLWAMIIQAIIWGFVALFTPCIFPMVPMTVSFFMKGSANKAAGRFKAIMYGVFIIVLYTVPIAALILITRIFGGDAVTADIFNWLATNWLPNILFFIVFMVFAASFFGLFEITMPGSLTTATDSKANSKGLGGVFFMALTLVLVSFSCTGPIVSSVLIKSTQGEIWEPIITMFAFSAAFALPFTVFAFAPSLLKDLPKSGGWLNSVKVVLGFIEVALGLKFLSVADQVYQWNLLDREVYLAIWIVVFSLLGMYLLGKLRFAHDTPEDHISVKRLFLSIVVFSFVVYMIPGMWGAPLKALSGYLPPIESIDFNLAKQQTVVMQGAGVPDTHNNPYPAKKFTDMGLKHIDGIPGFFDLQEALEYSKSAGKPVFIDFTGAACVNCREMESRVFSDPAIKNLLNNNFVFVSIYGDVKTEVPQQEWVTLPNGKVLKSLGKINTNFIMDKYKVNAMPYYIIVDAQGNEIVEPRGYDLDKDAFVQFLNNATEVFNKQ